MQKVQARRGAVELSDKTKNKMVANPLYGDIGLASG